VPCVIPIRNPIIKKTMAEITIKPMQYLIFIFYLLFNKYAQALQTPAVVLRSSTVEFFHQCI
jgi:hypothetical protein